MCAQRASIRPDSQTKTDKKQQIPKSIAIIFPHPAHTVLRRLKAGSQSFGPSASRLIKQLLQCKKELESGKLDPAHEQDYEQYFIVRTTPVRDMQVDFNDEVIKAYRNRYAGFCAIMTTRKLDALETLQIYRNKDVVKKCFDDLKNQLDLKQLQIHSSQRMSARIFVQFIALIFMSQVQKTMRESALSERYSPRLLLEEMESLTRIHYTGKCKDIISEVNKSQHEILESFSSDPNTL